MTMAQQINQRHPKPCKIRPRLSKQCRMHVECRGEGHASGMTQDARAEMARVCFASDPEVRDLQLARKREERRRLHKCHTSALVPVNPGMRDDDHSRDRGESPSEGRWPGYSSRSCHLYVLWFGRMGTTYLMVWAYSLQDALEEGAQWCADHAPGLLSEEQYKEAFKEAIEDGKSEEEAWDEAEVDMTYTESGHIGSDEWGIEAEDPSREDLIRLRDRLVPTTYDYDQGGYQVKGRWGGKDDCHE